MNATFQVLFGAICISWAPILVKLVDVEAGVSAFYRVAIGGIALALLSRKKRDPVDARSLKPENTKKWIIWVVLAGLFFALDLGMWHRAIATAGAGISTFLANMNVIYLTIYGIIFFKEKLSLRYGLLILGALLGSILLTQVDDWYDWSEDYQKGILLAFLTGIAYSAFVLALRMAEKYVSETRFTGPASLAGSSLSAAFFLALSTAVSGESWKLSSQDFMTLFALAMIAQVAGWGLISRSLSRLPLSLSGMLLLLQPVMTSVWAHLLFEETWDSSQLAGAALCLCCLYIAQQPVEVKTRD